MLMLALGILRIKKYLRVQIRLEVNLIFQDCRTRQQILENNNFDNILDLRKGISACDKGSF